MCPNHHIVYPACGISSMINAGYFWCGKCSSGYLDKYGEKQKGMYYPPSVINEKD
jgi:hypothetical protein